MKKWCVLTLVILLAFTTAACGCQRSDGMDTNTTVPPTSGTNETTPAPTVTDPIVDPTILDPTFETNIPDGTVNENSTNETNGMMP